MIIIGINAYHADSSAAIFKDGIMLAAIEEERFRRVKHWAGFPSLAVQFCLKEAGVTIEQVDHIAIGRDPKAKFFKKAKFLLKNLSGSIDVIKDRLANSKKVVEAIVVRIQNDVKNGNSFYYFTVKDNANIFVGSSQISNQLPLTAVGDLVKISYDEENEEIIDVSTFENVSLKK